MLRTLTPTRATLKSEDAVQLKADSSTSMAVTLAVKKDIRTFPLARW